MTADYIYQSVAPLFPDLTDAFDVATSRLFNFYESNPSYRRDGYFDSHFMRYVVKNELMNAGLTLEPQPNTGIEIIVPSFARIKVLRSDHTGDAPRARGPRRTAYCSTSQAVVQPMLSPTNGGDANAFWKAYFIGRESDGLAHLILDWALRGDQVVMFLSEPTGVVDNVMQLAWRIRVDAPEEATFIPTDEEISIFGDEEESEEVRARCSASGF